MRIRQEWQKKKNSKNRVYMQSLEHYQNWKSNKLNWNQKLRDATTQIFSRLLCMLCVRHAASEVAEDSPQCVLLRERYYILSNFSLLLLLLFQSQTMEMKKCCKRIARARKRTDRELTSAENSLVCLDWKLTEAWKTPALERDAFPRLECHHVAGRSAADRCCELANFNCCYFAELESFFLHTK